MLAALRDEFVAVWRARDLALMMARREIAARHAGSAIGLIWVYAQPVLTIAAYFLVFDLVFAMRVGVGERSHAVGAFLVVGMLPWMAFADAVSRGMNSLIDAGGLLQKNALPPALFPARTVLAGMAIHLPLIVLLALAYVPLNGPTVALFGLPVLLLGQLALCLLLSYALAILAAALRDVLQVVGFLLSVGVFTAPILFPIDRFPDPFGALLWLNPMTPLVLGYQSILLDGQFPGAPVWMGLLGWVSVIAFLLDRLVSRSREQLVDWL